MTETTSGRRWGLRLSALVLTTAFAVPGVLRGVSNMDRTARWTDSWNGGGCYCANYDENSRTCEIADDEVAASLWEPVYVHGSYDGASGHFALFLAPDDVDKDDVFDANLNFWYGLEPGDFHDELGYMIVRDGFFLPGEDHVGLELNAGRVLCDDGTYHLVSYQEGAQEWDLSIEFQVEYDERPGGGCFTIDCSDDSSNWRDDDDSTDDDTWGDDDTSGDDDSTVADDDTTVADDDTTVADDDDDDDDSTVADDDDGSADDDTT